MSMAIKYQMMKKAKGGMCEHGSRMCEMCHGGKALADGGDVEEDPSTSPSPTPKERATAAFMKGFSNSLGGSSATADEPEQKARGGEVGEDMDEEDMSDLDMIGQIMKSRAKRFSKGGQVANDEGEGMDADMEPNQFDALVKDDSLEFHDNGSDSGDQIGDHQEDEDRHDIVSAVMKSRKLKDRLPKVR